MSGLYCACPHCGHADLDPRRILVGMVGQVPGTLDYREIITLKCQNCGWLGEEESPLRKQA